MSISIKAEVKVTATVELTEGHLRALDAMAGYGADAFLKAFYVKLGRAYMSPFERDLRELFSMIRSDVPVALKNIEDARNNLKGGVS